MVSRRQTTIALSSIIAAALSGGSALGKPNSDDGTGRRLNGSYKPFQLDRYPTIFSAEEDFKSVALSRIPVVADAVAKFLAGARARVGRAEVFQQTYSGCDLSIYLKRFTFEDGGAARIASDFAACAYILGTQQIDPGKTSYISFAASSKKILLSWATNGFKRQSGSFMKLSDFCADGSSTFSQTASSVGLQLGRGIPYIVNAYALLCSVGSLSSDERQHLEAFLDNMFVLLCEATMYRFYTQRLECNRYSNHLSIQIAALLSIARCRGNKTAFEQIGAGLPGDVLPTSWPGQIYHSIYGENDVSVSCYPNDASADFRQTATPAAGELVDRYRAGQVQTFGYPMLSLDHLLLSAKLLDQAGFDPYEFDAGKGKTLLNCCEFYAGYYGEFLSNRISVVDTSESKAVLRDLPQYLGKTISRGPSTISGADRLLLPFLRAVRVFPKSNRLKSLIDKVVRMSPSEAFGSLDSLAIFELKYFCDD